MATINRPVEFQGTMEERVANYRTHSFDGSDADARCFRCDSKRWHIAADYPCGVEPPRETVEVS